jgi:hypothetical protein
LKSRKSQPLGSSTPDSRYHPTLSNQEDRGPDQDRLLASQSRRSHQRRRVEVDEAPCQFAVMYAWNTLISLWYCHTNHRLNSW